MSEVRFLHPKLLMASAICAMVMIPTGMILTSLGVFVLKVSGGAATDTSLVILTAGFAVSDFWGGGIVKHLTRAADRDVAIAWLIARSVILVLFALVFSNLLILVPIQLVVALGAAYAGARVAAAQRMLRSSREARNH